MPLAIYYYYYYYYYYYLITTTVPLLLLNNYYGFMPPLVSCPWRSAYPLQQSKIK